MPRLALSAVWITLLGSAALTAQAQGCMLNSKRFVAQGPTVTDMSTGLVWSRCNLPRRFNAATQTCDGSAFATDQLNAALSAVAGMSREPGGPWRLPTVAELKAVFDPACSPEDHQKSPFASLDITPLWSSSTDASGKTWQLDREGNKGRPDYQAVENGAATIIGVRDGRR